MTTAYTQALVDELLAAIDATPAPSHVDGSGVHLACCKPNRTLCGRTIVQQGGDGDRVTCQTCDDIDMAGLTCGAPLCKLRQRWRARRYRWMP